MLAKASHRALADRLNFADASEPLDAPCYDSIHAAAQRLNFSGAAIPDMDALNRLARSGLQAIATTSGQAISFAAQNVDPSADGYEAQIFTTGAVPTRPHSIHDLFNALVWLSFPLSKAAINARHMAASEPRSSAKNRGPVQDALTLFDECGVIVASDRPDLLQLIERFAWKELFWRQRESVVRHMRFFLFGHGLMEQMLTPYIGLTGKALLMNIESAWLEGNTDALLRHIDASSRARIASPACFVHGRELLPLPLLGIPGWSRENERESYYDNVRYFRPGRRQEN
jgi:Protein of unknown function (DUF3025)